MFEATHEPPWKRPLDFLPMIVGRLVAKANPIRIILFGSHAKGGAKAGSDLDLLVIVDQIADMRRERAALRQVISDLDVPVDLVMATPALLDEHGDTIGFIFRPALREGRVVYERR